ncbi:MAG TPA: DNA methyltransferase, partial [candidate division Zixibacteria bacterium]|nr:DNA methyltransferase [candidate division Zixibacteria bacterium]
MINKYLKEISDAEHRGDAREESYYPSLKSLIESIGKKKKVVVTVNPKKTEGGNPDFRVWDGKQKITGYIEAKIPGSNLSKIEDTEQLKRYFKAFPNVILTNFYEFWLYRDGELVEKVEIAFHSITKKVKTKPPVKDEKEFVELLETFFLYTQPKIYNAQDLALTLANKTRHLERIVLEILESDIEKKSDIYGFYNAFKEYLISDLDIKQFSDLYAQTITYGLFAARSRTDEKFSRKLAFDNIPHTIGILRDLFQNISLGNPLKEIEWIVDDISSVLAIADINKIMDTFYIEGKGNDPIIYFYETFLAAYDPQLRNKRGVYYTPESVVSYIVRSVNEILKNDFGKSDGLADTSVTLLDPAAGTLTFIAHAFHVAMEEFNNN